MVPILPPTKPSSRRQPSPTLHKVSTSTAAPASQSLPPSSPSYRPGCRPAACTAPRVQSAPQCHWTRWDGCCLPVCGTPPGCGLPACIGCTGHWQMLGRCRAQCSCRRAESHLHALVRIYSHKGGDGNMGKQNIQVRQALLAQKAGPAWPLARKAP